MSEPRAHRRYTRKQKLSAVMAAEMVGVVAASEQAGIPATTIEYWLQSPAFAEFRTRTREDLAAEVEAVAHLAWQRVAEGLRAGTFEPRDALFAAEKATTLFQLVSGQATTRTETRELGSGLDDHELEALTGAIDEWLAERATP